jgi:hypothetical protein
VTVYTFELPRNDRRLGRLVVHDSRSRGFARPGVVDRSTWHTHSIRIYDPVPNPNQTIGSCTACAKCMQLNAVGNRKAGRVLNLGYATSVLYPLSTRLDPFPGEYPPTDTGSSGLASAKAAKQLGIGGDYFWLFDVNAVVQAVIDGDVVSVGTVWTDGMFDLDGRGFIAPTGNIAGGHQYAIRGYHADLDALVGRCWWGPVRQGEVHRDFYIRRDDLGDLLSADGDAHVQARV